MKKFPLLKPVYLIIRDKDTTLIQCGSRKNGNEGNIPKTQLYDPHHQMLFKVILKRPIVLKECCFLEEMQFAYSRCHRQIILNFRMAGWLLFLRCISLFQVI